MDPPLRGLFATRGIEPPTTVVADAAVGIITRFLVSPREDGRINCLPVGEEFVL